MTALAAVARRGCSCWCCCARVKPLGLYMADVFDGRPIWPLRALGERSSAASTACAASIRRAEMAWKQYAIALLLFNVLGALAVYALQRLQAWLPLNPQRFAGRHAGLVLQHRRQLRHQHQLAGLRRRVDHELPHADGRARGAELPLRGHRHRGGDRADPRLRAPHARRPSATSGSISRARRSTSCCRCRCCWRSLLVSQGVIQNFERYKDVDHRSRPLTYQQPEDRRGRQSAQGCGGQRGHRDRDQRRRRRCRWARSPRRRAIKELGTNGGGFFNANSAHPYENPTPLTQLPRDARDPADSRARCAYTFGSMVGDTRQGWAVLAAMIVAVRRRWSITCVAQRAAGQSAHRHARRRPGRQRAAGGRQHGRQGDALRHRRLGALRDRHHGGLLRRGQRHARLVHAARRPRADVADPARRGRLRRRRHRPVRAC